MPPRRTFGNTWWGRAWVEALEQRASVDPNRLPRGRTYARKGTVSALAVGPGELTARVRGSRPEPYRVTIRMREFTPEEWSRLLDVIGRRLGHTAALLDGELPEELAAQAREAGADLLPGPGDLRPRCSCPDSANPCKHVAAVYYLVADEVDADPFVLFKLRGRPRDEVLATLRSLRTPDRPKRARVRDPGLTPKSAYSRRVTAVPALPPVPDVAGPPAVLDLDPPASTGWTSERLVGLAADAAAWARDLLVSGGAAAELTFEEDLARRAAARPPAELAGLAADAGLPLADLTAWAQAWAEAGRGGLSALRDTWSPGPGPLADARACLAESGSADTVAAWRNRVTQGPLQLRYGRDHRWYRFVRAGSAWRLDGPPSAQPLDVAYPPE
ncbi:SWIM zinc finger family protein [Amycolatopsis sp. FDAARGOS 1241]|uniref:SWIM zinc finger family protein n=1 Tax=Amycolatopsis sp. FDAARGOS 1241 TaxID=2778070 RepID=UPI001951A8FB|nr:SWIM zinc finger family protein [Amycolatopsis sp. FDAARGOS 1241]QRP44003.1 SWIM zinc finger family protein [Amycolatopsis sp. FDAARGOS 1241]